MIHNFKTRKQIKSILVVTNIVLGILLLSLSILGILVISPNKIRQAEKLNQYKLFSMDNLPQFDDTIQPEYVQAAKIKAMPKKQENDEGEGNEESQIIQKVTQETAKKTKNAARIAIIITDLGLNKYNTELAVNLPRQFALGFLPYAANLKSLIDKAGDHSHEIFLHLPLATDKLSHSESKYSLQTKLSAEENINRLNLILNLSDRYSGIYTNYNEKFTDNKNAAVPIIDNLADRNLIFVLGKTSNLIRLSYLQKKNNIIAPNIIIDAELDRESIEKNLKLLIENAKKNKTALGYAGSYTLTLNILKEWIDKFAKYGVDLVPVSELGEAKISE